MGSLESDWLWAHTLLDSVQNRTSTMTPDERSAFELGCESVLDEMFAEIAELEESRSDTSYGKGQLYILRELVGRMTEGK
jgi:hypothetical protein